jgi:hypothetical protein
MKNKTFLAVVLLSLLQLTNAISQTNALKFDTVLTTNWVAPGPYLRIVDGQLYNTFYSKKWDYIWRLAHSSPRPYSNPDLNHSIASSVEVEKISSDKILCNVYEDEFQPEIYTGSLTLIGKTFIKTIIVYNYPNAETLVSGNPISGAGYPEKQEVRCIRVKNYMSENESYEAYDCGIQSTNLIPVVTKHLQPSP